MIKCNVAGVAALAVAIGPEGDLAVVAGTAEFALAVSPLGDFVASSEYRREMVRVLAKRVVVAALQ